MVIILGPNPFGTLDFTEDGIIQKLDQIVEQASGGQSTVDIESQLEKLPIALSASMLSTVAFVSAIFATFTLNLPFIFSEEFGWRGLPTCETQIMGFLKSNIFIGVFWGLWHAPVILMGHNYPDYPVLKGTGVIPFAV